MLYEGWGFTGSPFQTTSLPPTEFGQKLMVGRDTELRQFTRKLLTPPKMVTLEGLNGVGKTSIVNVGTYRIFAEYCASGKGQLLVPCRKIFQLNPDHDLNDFIDSVMREVAQTLLEQKGTLGKIVKAGGGDALDRWLNSPQLVGLQAGFTAGPVGLQGGFQRENSTTVGYERSGFRKAVEGILESVFPSLNDGGIVCVIDNLELLESSEAARKMLEQLRDELFNRPGLRWVLCGALGIVYGVVSSPRLDGYLHTPVEIGEMQRSLAPDILRTRIEAFTSPTAGKPYLPLTPASFGTLYDILRGNLRSVLNYADNYCQWIGDQSSAPGNDVQREASFKNWLQSTSKSQYDAVRTQLTPRAEEVFRKGVELEGVFAPSDFSEFGFNSTQAFRPHIATLEGAGLLVSTQDEGDKRRKTIQVTPKGWLVDHHLKP